MVYRLPDGGPVRVRTSNSAAELPTAAELEEGEIALNAADGVLYYQNQSGAIGPVGFADAPADDNTYGRKAGEWVDITSPANLQVRRGTAAEVAAITPLQGEPVWATDTKRLVVGDGATAGGVPVGGFPLEGTAAGVLTPPFTVPHGNIFVAAGVEVRGLSFGKTLVAGNARGIGAVDLQIDRTAATRVASGRNSSLIGGSENTASSTSAAVIGGYLNMASADSAAVIGGFENAASASRSIVLGGSGNTASGPLAIAGGVGATASGERSVAISGIADRLDMHARGMPTSTLYGSSVRAQEVSFILGKLTTDGTPAAMTSALLGNLTIPSGVALACTVEIFGLKTTDATEAAHYIRKLVIRNVGGETELMGAVTTVGTDYESSAGLDVTITADNGTDSLRVEVTGLAGTSIRWVAVVRGLELQF